MMILSAEPCRASKGSSSHVRRNVLQAQECEEVRMGYLESMAECSMEAIKDVIRSVPAN